MSRDALVVGINNYDYDGLKNLNAPAADAEAIAQRLEQYGEFKPTRLPAVKDKENNTTRVGKSKESKVNLTKLEEAIVQLFKPNGKSPDTALLYFSGHGLRKNRGITEGYLATSDVDPKNGKWGLSLQWLRRLLLESEVRQQIIILDCCYSGEVLNCEEADPGDRGKGRDRFFIAASREYEVAYEEIDNKHSVLTSLLLKGLEPKQDQWVTNHELASFLSQQKNCFPQVPVYAYSGQVINLTRRRTLNTLDSTAKSEQDICPYKGLAYFDFTEEDAKYFYGRIALIDQLLEKVRTSNFLAILGASGSGKSSVVRAGLLYQLKLGQRLSSSNNWQIRILKPGEQPLQSLALAFVERGLSDIDRAIQLDKAEELIANGAVGLEKLIKVADTKRVVLVVDQFEEAFTLCQDIKERQQFFECLLGAVRKISNKLCLVLTMRSDFFGKCTEQEYSGLAQEIQQSLVTVTPMTESELRQVIVQPAKQVNLEIEPELVEQILKDVTNAPGYLPLLEYTLTEMWKQHTDNCLRLNNYAKLGGVMGTLRQRATEVYESFSDETQKSAVRHIFLSLTQLGEGTEDTRRRVCQQDLVNKKYSEELINQVVQRLADEKLIVTEIVEKSGISGRVAVVDVAHEALIRYWSHLREWVDKNRDALKTERKIQAAAEEWEKQGKSTDYLFKGLQLAQAEKLIEDDINTVVLSPLALEFIQTSQQEHNRQEKEIREQKLSTISILTTSSQELFDSNKDFDALLASLNAAKEMKQAAFEIPSDLQFRVKVALQQAVYWIKERNRLEGHKAGVFSVSYSPDGKTLASASGDTTVKLWDVATGKEVSTLTGHKAGVFSVSYSPDGKTLASASGDTTVKLWDVATGEEIFTFSEYKADDQGNNGISFSPDGRLLAFASERYAIQVWDIATRQQIATLTGHKERVNGVSFSPDGRLLASASFDGTVKLWDVTTRKEIPTKIDYRLFLNGVSFSPDGQLLAVGGDVGTVELWDVTTRNKIPLNFSGFIGRVTNLSFSPNGQLLVASGFNNAIKLWDVATGIEMSSLTGHLANVNNVKFSPDGQWLASASNDHSIKLWYIGQHQEIKTLSGHIYLVDGVSFSLNGRLLVSGSRDNTVKLWDVATGKNIKTFSGHEHWVSSVSFSPDGKSLASGSWDNTVKLWDVATGKNIKTFFGHEHWVRSVSFSPDGKSLASGSWDLDKTVKLWDVATGKKISTLTGHKDGIKAVSFSPDGRLLASASRDQTIKLWDVATGKELATITGYKVGVESVSFSPDGRLLASADDINIKLWDVATSKELAILTGHKVVVNSVSFSSDGRLLASASDDHTIILWDVVTHKEINIFNAKTKVNSISFSPDGQLLASGCESGTVILWNLEALSNLTLEELMARGCDWVCSYLQTNPNVSNSDKQLCDGISTAK